MNPIRNLLIGGVCLLSLAASAQWQWIDKDGRRVFSDRSPPPDISDKNILKRPGSRGAPSVATETPPTEGTSTPGAAQASAPPTSASAPKLSGIDKALADKKKKSEEVEVAQRKAEEERITKVKAENCVRAKRAKASFESGIRVAEINDKGEREIMNDAARAAEVKRMQAIMDTDCK